MEFPFAVSKTKAAEKNKGKFILSKIKINIL
jgi:hypothetical protein